MTAPVLTNYQLAGLVSPDQFNTFCQTTTLTTDLRSLTGVSGMQVEVRGVAAANDGGAGAFYWSPNATGTDDGVNTICPNGVTLGRWLRLKPLGSVWVNYATPIAGVTLCGTEAIPSYVGMYAQGTTLYETAPETMRASGLYVTKGATQTGKNTANKTADYIGVRVQAGGGDSWARNTLAQADATAPNVNIFGEEIDCNNLGTNARDGITWAPFIGHQVSMMGVARGAAAYSAVGNTTAGWGWSVAFSVGQSTAAQDAAFRDLSNATISLDLRGSHGLAIDGRAMTLTGASWMIAPGGGASSWYIGGNIYRGINMTAAGVLQLGQDATSLSFFGATGAAKATVTGSKGSNAALASLMTALAAYGIVVDSTT